MSKVICKWQFPPFVPHKTVLQAGVIEEHNYVNLAVEKCLDLGNLYHY